MFALSSHHRGIVGVPPSDDFVAQIETTTPDEVFEWPFRNGGTYNATIDYGDGSPLGSITNWNDPDRSHVYATPGTHTVTIVGQLGGFQFWGQSEGSKIKRILNAGNNMFDGSWLNAFRQTSGLQGVDAGNLANVTNHNRCFQDCPVTTIQLDAAGSGDLSLFAAYNDFLVNAKLGAVGVVTNFASGFDNCPLLETLEITSLSGGSSYSANNFCRSCGSLVAAPAIDFSGATACNSMFDNNNSLTTFHANAFDTCLATDFGRAWRGCALDQQSVDNILVSIDTAGQSNGTLDITGTSAPPGPAGQTAKANLQGRGWTVNTN